MYSVDAELDGERRSGDEEGQREGGSERGRRGKWKGGELEAKCVLMLCSFLK